MEPINEEENSKSLARKHLIILLLDEYLQAQCTSAYMNVHMQPQVMGFLGRERERGVVVFP